MIGNRKNEILTDKTSLGEDNPFAVVYNFDQCAKAHPSPKSGHVKYFILTDDDAVLDEMYKLMPNGTVLAVPKRYPIVPTYTGHDYIGHNYMRH